MIVDWYNLNGALLRVDADDPALLRPLLVYLNGLSAAPSDRQPDFTISIHRGQLFGDPPNAKLLSDRPRPEAPVCRLSAEGNSRWFVIPEKLSLKYSTADRVAKICVAPGHERLVGGTAAIHAIYAALHASGQMLVHSAALKLPDRDAALMLFAPCGAGKTTTSLALALQRFNLLTDDAAVMAANRVGDLPSVWGLPRPPKVHQRTAEMLPEIGRLLGERWNADGEQGLPIDTLRSVVEVLPGKPYPLVALVMLGNRVQGPHSFRPMPKSELFVHFANDNIARSPYGLGSDELARYHRFVSMVATTPTFELNVGSKLDELGEVISSVLKPVGHIALSA